MEGTPALLAAFTIAHLAYFFGWRASTASVLTPADLSFSTLQGHTSVLIDERVTKGAATRSAHLFRRLEVSSAQAPGLVAGLQALAGVPAPRGLLFGAIGARQNLLDPGLTLTCTALHARPVPLAGTSDTKTELSSHSLRVGTCTALSKLGLPKE